MYLESGTGASVYKTKKSLKEFETMDGHKYAITRNEDGKLDFTEIYREKEGAIYGKDDIKTRSALYDLEETYKKAGIKESDLDEAFEIINETKEKETGEQENQKNQDDYTR